MIIFLNEINFCAIGWKGYRNGWEISRGSETISRIYKEQQSNLNKLPVSPRVYRPMFARNDTYWKYITFTKQPSSAKGSLIGFNYFSTVISDIT